MGTFGKNAYLRRNNWNLLQSGKPTIIANPIYQKVIFDNLSVVIRSPFFQKCYRLLYITMGASGKMPIFEEIIGIFYRAENFRVSRIPYIKK